MRRDITIITERAHLRTQNAPVHMQDAPVRKSTWKQPAECGPWIQVNRDPFARQSVERQRRYNIGNADCRGCGQSKHTAVRRLPYLYAYRVVPDSGRTYDIRGLYCSISCMRSAHIC